MLAFSDWFQECLITGFSVEKTFGHIKLDVHRNYHIEVHLTKQNND
jgi:hypothetical protein